MSTDTQPVEQTAPAWHPLTATERRVLGVLVEKAKTTPENYPLSLNALRAGCNQKSNRAPFMQLEEDQVEEALESLRKAGAVAQIQGGGRVDKYRHLAYEWLGVEKVELAVMAELLLRGTQTVGELRGRAARMEPIKDLAELQPTLDSLHAKRLVVYLSPPGRGSVVTHGLYQDREIEKVHREAGLSPHATPPSQPRADRSVEHSPPRSPDSGDDRTAGYGPRSTAAQPDGAPLEQQLQRMQDEIAGLKRDLLAARTEFESQLQDFRHTLDELNRQLGN